MHALNIDPLSSGAILSYPPGSRNLDPEGFRVVAGEEDRLASLTAALPSLRGFLGSAAPIAVNCFPAALGNLGSAVLIDTYLRPEAISRALLLAHRRKRSALLLGTPLVILEAVLAHVRRGGPLPFRLLYGVGGYACPESAEQVLVEVAREHGASGTVVHLYGIGELDLGCLAGAGRTAGGEIIYYPTTDRIRPLIRSGRMVLESVKGIPGGRARFDTGDTAEAVDGGFLIHNSAERLDPVLLRELNRWGRQEWERRTGYVGRLGGEWIFQLRQHVVGAEARELGFFVFAEHFGFSWLDRPDWGSKEGLRFAPPEMRREMVPAHG